MPLMRMRRRTTGGVNHVRSRSLSLDCFSIFYCLIPSFTTSSCSLRSVSLFLIGGNLGHSTTAYPPLCFTAPSALTVSGFLSSLQSTFPSFLVLKTPFSCGDRYPFISPFQQQNLPVFNPHSLPLIRDKNSNPHKCVAILIFGGYEVDNHPDAAICHPRS